MELSALGLETEVCLHAQCHGQGSPLPQKGVRILGVGMGFYVTWVTPSADEPAVLSFTK